MSDIRDILNLAPKEQAQKKPQIAKPKKKPHGVSREIFRLTGGTVAPTSSHVTKAALKQKRKFGTRKAVKWAWKSYKNPARKDGLVLYRWVKAEDKEEDYPFAVLNKKIKVFQYSAEEYTAYLEDPGWTKSETDRLIELCKTYDLRFPVIADRYDCEKPRTIDELKKRYYTVAQTLLKLRARDDRVLREHPVMSQPFDFHREVTRKQQLERLLNRTWQEEAEEEDIREKLQKIEDIKKRRADEQAKRDAELQRLLKDRSSGIGAMPPGTPGYAVSPMYGSQSFTPQTPISETPTSAAGRRKKTQRERDIDLQLAAALGTPTESETPSSMGPRKMKTGVHTRYQLMLQPITTNVGLNKRIDTQMESLGVAHGSFRAYTTRVHESFDEVRTKIMELVDLQKQTDRKETAVRLLCERRDGILRRLGRPPGPPPSVFAKKGLGPLPVPESPAQTSPTSDAHVDGDHHSVATPSGDPASDLGLDSEQELTVEIPIEDEDDYGTEEHESPRPRARAATRKGEKRKLDEDDEEDDEVVSQPKRGRRGSAY